MNREMPDLLKWILTAIQRVGFPIIMCIYFAWLQFVGMRQMTEILEELKNAVNKNTEMVQKIFGGQNYGR